MARRAMPHARDALPPLGGLALAAGLFLLVLLVWGSVRAGLDRGIDDRILLFFRQPGRPDLSAAPPWFDILMRDVTVLGGGRVLTLLVTGAAGLFIVRRSAGSALLLAAAAYSGSTVVNVIKGLVRRVRPDIVTQFVTERTFSFPSAHAANSSLVFLTIAALATRLEADIATRRYTMAVAIMTTLLVGTSRVYLGVHWPTDVAAGWCFGAGWAALWLIVAERLLPAGHHGRQGNAHRA